MLFLTDGKTNNVSSNALKYGGLRLYVQEKKRRNISPKERQCASLEQFRPHLPPEY